MTFSYILSGYLKIIINTEFYLQHLPELPQKQKQNMVMKTCKELLGTCIKSKQSIYEYIMYQSASNDSPNCFAIFGSSACQGQHVFSMSFLTCTAP